MKKILLLIVVLCSLVGCAQKENQHKKEVHLSNSETKQEAVVTITINTEAKVITTKEMKFKEGQTLMDIMKDNFDIETIYEGTFISGIDGILMDEEIKIGWFCFINGEVANVGANDYILKPGDKISFDYLTWE